MEVNLTWFTAVCKNDKNFSMKNTFGRIYSKNLDYFIIVFFFWAARKIRNFQISLFIVYFLKSTQFIAIAFKVRFLFFLLHILHFTFRILS